MRVQSSPGDYPRKISQKAVENITALGGASAAAAIQRMFLRFFEQFDYEKLGWSCRLEKGVCRMGGVENTAQGYVIVKGSGVPALSVMGYNRDVNWEVLLERVKRVAQDNVRAVVRMSGGRMTAGCRARVSLHRLPERSWSQCDGRLHHHQHLLSGGGRREGRRPHHRRSAGQGNRGGAAGAAK